MNAYEEYMKQLVVPMRQELTTAGFTELTTEEEVQKYMENASDTTLVMVNSVCGCAAGLARPAVTQSIVREENTPANLVTVFAGQDKDATAAMRTYFKGYEPSSPSIALLKGQEVVHFIPREDIEDHTMEDIMNNLGKAYREFCS